jgi:cyclic beta-1,2-glucan synthetase
LHYLAVTGDTTLLDETVTSVEGGSVSLYEQCVRVIETGLAVVQHGLSPTGSGAETDRTPPADPEGRGASVWLAWFLLTVVPGFARVAETRGDPKRARHYREHADRLRRAVEATAWKGAWYRRALFDGGPQTDSPPECRIDSMSQTWAVLCGQAEPGRAVQAMQAVWEQLVRKDERLVLLFTPPYDDGRQQDFAAGYLPGVRDNGGQLTHAAAWVAAAFALLGQHERAAEVLDLLNPIQSSATPSTARGYAVEPYVMADDVYAAPAPVGRGGWTWFTGAAGWYYRVAIETVLGLEVRCGRLVLHPRIPPRWPGYTLRLRHGTATYAVSVENGGAGQVRELWCDGVRVTGEAIDLKDDGREHAVRVVLG